MVTCKDFQNKIHAVITAASDTTSLTLTWALALLITNPSVLKKAQDELDTKVGKDRNVEEHDVNDLVYLQAVVKETLRMYAAAPLDVPHEAIADCKIGGYEVRAGTRLVVNLWKLHRDPRVWSNPSEFKPERFLSQLDGGSGGEAANLDFRGQDFEYLPFSSGRRICPGIDFAIQTVHMALARLLHEFDFNNDSEGLVIDMTEGSVIRSSRKTKPSSVSPPEVAVRFGMYPTLVVSSWEMSKECFTTNDRFLAGLPSGAANKYLTFASFCCSTYGPYWREIRKIATLHLLSHRRLELLKHVPYSEIGKCNHECDSKDGPSKEEEEGQKLHKTIIEFFALAGAAVASDAFPFLGWLDVDGQKKRMKRVAKDMDFIVSKWLEEHRHQRQQTVLSSSAAGGSNHDDAKDFMDVLMTVLDEGSDDLFFGFNRDTVIKATCLQIIAAGADTTSVTLTWDLALLITNPTVLRKAQDELDTKVGKDRNVEEHDINDLVYLQAIAKETLRTRLFVNLWKLHRDPRVWSSPLEFKPERFLPQLNGGSGGEAAKWDFRGQDFEYLPFGSGRRMCPGIDFALQMLHMALARLLHAFDFDNDAAGLVIDMTEGSSLTILKLTPLEVYLRPRLPVKLY
ncbi:hypothetical protein C5167_002852 [Papaver somniferum]|uniref:N-methylcoclaurine 3'-monooxygenase n=1 Tax=Papaver somniferum TaxID=3469 RepID=A0A4Y7L1M6_PAPSO|nr:hypothetical protein C5167_002852 [Papaver somniferum]